jgi:hypothetical protein
MLSCCPVVSLDGVMSSDGRRQGRERHAFFACQPGAFAQRRPRRSSSRSRLSRRLPIRCQRSATWIAAGSDCHTAWEYGPDRSRATIRMPG